MKNETFDIAVVGGGCSGFQLLHQLSLQADWSNKRVALFDDGVCKQRSWCFWSDKKHPLQHLVSKSWNNITFKGRDFSKTEDVSPYAYHYIAGEDFFNFFQKQFLNNNKNVESLNYKIDDFAKKPHGYSISSKSNQWTSQNLFSSLPPKNEAISARFRLKQHFKGWFIRTEQATFDETTVMLMDFSIPQHDDTRFVYVLPFSTCEALVEMTVFSPTIYPDTVYDTVLQDYMNEHYPNTKFTIENTEQGAIPMTDALFSRLGTEGEVLLGTAAGMVKASTGYAFKRITKDSRQLAEDENMSQKPRWATSKGRFRFYDRLLLGILKDEPLKGSVIFEALFKKMSMRTIFKFLDEDTHLWEEIKLFSKLPFTPFLKQIYRQWTLRKT
jgi:lycopene beta-cyclase